MTDNKKKGKHFKNRVINIFTFLPFVAKLADQKDKIFTE